MTTQITRSAIVAGFDGCKPGWIGAIWRGPGSPPTAIHLASLATAERELAFETIVIAVDIPLGLLEAAVRGGRLCDQQARQQLGRRASSVFSPPVMAALKASTYREACELNQSSGPEGRKISKQSFAIFPKLIDGERSVRESEWLRNRIIEVHPELCFRTMAGFPLITKKKRAVGKDERRQLLRDHGFAELPFFERAARDLGAASDDALDACVSAWTAWRHAAGTAKCLPTNASGSHYSMRIWY